MSCQQEGRSRMGVVEMVENMENAHEIEEINKAQEWCEECHAPTVIEEIHEEEFGIGFAIRGTSEEATEIVKVFEFACGHTGVR